MAGAKRIHCDRTQPGALTAALAGHRDAFDVIYDHTAYRPADMEPLISVVVMALPLARLVRLRAL